MLQPLVGKNSHILSYPHFSILWSYHVSLHFNPYFLHCSQWACRATLAWRFLYSFWASFLHPLTICHTISVDSPHNLHSGVSDDIYMLCLTEFVLRACSWVARIKPSVSFLKKTFLSYLQDSSPATSELCEQTFHIGLFLFSCFVSPLSFSSCSPKDSLLQQTPSLLKPSAASTLCYSSGSHARIWTPP